MSAAVLIFGVSGASAATSVVPDQAQITAALKAAWAQKIARGEAPSAATEPSISAGTILTPHIDVTKAPGVPGVQLTLQSGTVGAYSVTVGIVNPAGNHYYGNPGFASIPAFPPEPASEKINLQLSYSFVAGSGSLYTAPGAWRIYTVSILSLDGTTITYTGTQLAALFPSLVINVANSSTPDNTPPTIGTGRVLTPVVRLSSKLPYFAAELSVADNLSGVANVQMSLVQPSTGNGVYAQSNITYPIRQGNVIASVGTSRFLSPGTYNIELLSVCDVAGNCLSQSTPAEIQATLGATSFQVVN